MDSIYTIIVVILMALAVSDLIVGVSNDAVNFLNSAIGSKAAPRYVIMLVASAGILLGSVFSSGMMEVARSGVFNPAMFTFQDIMILFLAVMLTDVILLDLFNTLGLPTSTTVSLVFELLGSAVAVALVIISRNEGETMVHLSRYINTGKAMAIIFGILISVVIAFVCGTVVMYVTRLLFTFRYKRAYRVLGPFWCGIAFTAISYFALFKGLKGTSLVSPEALGWMGTHTLTVLLVMFGAWVLISAFLQYVLKVNVLRITVLAGTLSLALAFAGNDLVNFIGVFMAGYDSYHIAKATGDVHMLMGDLNNPVVANTLILFAAGAVMTLTLWFSKKARSVTETEINLARQDTGVERFGSTSISRAIVRLAVSVNKNLERFTPASVQRFIARRFAPLTVRDPDKAPFDLIRATVNLTVASILISSATSLKLPLSTTYVTFMVAMGSSLADRAWGRESAVYRITGVLTVISGWFLTAAIAFAVSSLVALVLMWGGTIALVLLLALCAFILIRSNITHRKKRTRQETAAKDAEEEKQEKGLIDTCAAEICETMKKAVSIYNRTLEGVFREDRRLLKQTVRESEELYTQAHNRKYEVFPTLKRLQDNYIYTGHYYVQVVDYLDEVSKALLHICRPCYEHINNNHEGLHRDQVEDLMKINEKVSAIYHRIIDMLEHNQFGDLDTILVMRDALFEDIARAVMNQIRRAKRGETSTKSGMLYLDIINETKTMVLQSRNLLKSQKFFVSNIQE